MRDGISRCEVAALLQQNPMANLGNLGNIFEQARSAGGGAVGPFCAVGTLFLCTHAPFQRAEGGFISRRLSLDGYAPRASSACWSHACR